MPKMRRIILASSSPYRKQLLQQLIGNNFEVGKSSYVEDNTLDLDPVKLAMHHALQKGRDVAGHFDSGIVISADTFILFEGRVIGKPHTVENAKKTLRKLSGNLIDAISGIAVIDIDAGKELQDYEVTKVKFKELTDKEIDAYVKSGEPLDKAGAFGIGAKGAVFIEKVDGCYSNIIGLPLFKLNRLLNQLGISIFDFGS